MKPSSFRAVAPLALALSLLTTSSICANSILNDTITDADATSHTFSVVYSSELSVDPDSLGDNDLYVGRGSLFKRELGAQAVSPTFVDAKSVSGTNGIVARYRIDRPEGGWASWNLTEISVRTKDIRNTRGATLSISLGDLKISLRGLTDELRLREGTFPIVDAINGDSFDFEVTYLANYALDLDLFDQGEVFVRIENLDLDRPPTLFGPARSSTQIVGSVVQIQESENGQEASVTYRFERPEVGWGIREQTPVLLDVVKLGENGRGEAIQGLVGVGRVQFLYPGKLAGAVSKAPPASFDDEFVQFEVTYTSSPGDPISVESLGNDDIGSLLSNFATGERGTAKLEDVVSVSQEGEVVTARYRLERPELGWQFIGANERLGLITLLDGVTTASGSDLIVAPVGYIYFHDVAERAPQLVALDDWFRDLGDALGEDAVITAQSDHDNDGAEDLIEIVVATDPFNAQDATPLDVSLQRIEGEERVQLAFKQRTNLRDVELILEGSATGTDWRRTSHYFRIVQPTLPNDEGIREVLLQSTATVDQMPFRFFRLRVATF